MHFKVDFLAELAKACLLDKRVLDVIRPHLSFGYIPQESLKRVYKYIFDYYDANKNSPSFGLLSQAVTHPDSLEVLGEIRNVSVGTDRKRELIGMFEQFIKDARFQILWTETEQLHNAGKKQEALRNLAATSAEINNFSLQRQSLSRIFGDFDKRQMQRASADHTRKFIPTSIPAMDHFNKGGFERGRAFLGIARSGVGKTTMLRSFGGSAAFHGFNVLHFLGGDAMMGEAEDGYDSWWTGLSMDDIKYGNTIDDAMRKKIAKSRQAYMANCGEIFVHNFNRLNAGTIVECRTILMDLMKEIDVHMVLFDYLDKFVPDNKTKFGTTDDGQRNKKMATAEAIVSIATEFDVVAGTMTQANDVAPEFYNDPNKYLTRSNISNLKATIDPFSYCFTLNQTDDENDHDIMRIHEEKRRGAKSDSWSNTYCIVQDREHGRFINLAATNEKFWNAAEKKIIRNVVKSETNGKSTKKPAGSPVARQ